MAQANLWLPRLLPEERSARPKDEVNARLVRHYSTQGLLSLPVREGREARYSRKHLLELLALRRLMADGLSGRALERALGGRSEAELEELAVQGSHWLERGGESAARGEPPQVAASSALSYLQGLRGSVGSQPSMLGITSPRPAIPRPAPSPAPALPAENKPSRARLAPQRVTRVIPVPGLEVQVLENLKWPKGEREWNALMADVRRALQDLQNSGPGRHAEELDDPPY